MIRFLGILFLLGVIAGPAWADKSKITVLGLEVTPGPGGTVDPATTVVAREVTKELRARAQSGSSPYTIAPNSNKELTDEKLLLSCDNEGKECMAVIGAGLASDVLLFGKVEKRGDNYRITLKLLDVKTRSLEVRSDDLPIGGSVAGVSKRLYGKLITDVGASALTVTVRGNGAVVDTGRVLIDDEKIGDLSAGTFTGGGLTEGRHSLAIEAGGFRRHEQNITVRAGRSVTIEVTLDARAVETASSKGALRPRWKAALGASVGVAVIGGALAIGGLVEQGKYSDNFATTVTTRKSIDPKYCGNDAQALMEWGATSHLDDYHSACHWYKAQIIGGVIAGVGGAAAIVSLILLLTDRDSATTEHAERATGPSIAIAPVLTTEQAGASLTVRW
ncbi:MAG TPA: carboxypeptidase-like regulatory domain-containing protein [Kofleriaceae bacterium]